MSAEAEVISRSTNVPLLFWDIDRRPPYKSSAHYAASNGHLKENDLIIAFQLPGDKNPKPVLTIYKRVISDDYFPCKSRPCESTAKLFKAIKIRQPNLVIVDMGNDVGRMDLRPLCLLCKHVGAKLMVNVTKLNQAAKPLFQYCNIVTWTGTFWNSECTISFVKKVRSTAPNFAAMPKFNPFISKATFILAEGLLRKGFKPTFGNPERHELVLDVQLEENLTLMLLMEVFATNPIGLIKNIKVVATGIVSFDTINLTLLGLKDQDVAEVVVFIDLILFIVQRISDKYDESDPMRLRGIEYQLLRHIKNEVDWFSDLFT